MANAGSIGKTEYVETWIADNIGAASADGLAWLQSSDGGTAFARAVAAGKGLHCQGVMAATDNHMHELCSDLLFVYGQDGHSVVEVLFMVSSIADLAFNIGFNDEALDSGNTLPAELAVATWTSTASAFAGLVYDVDATNDDLHCFWVNGDSDASETLATLRMAGIVPVANKWMMARVEIQDRGSGLGAHVTFHFAVDGKHATKEFDTTLARGTALCPYIAFENRDATAHTIYVKYIKVEQSISD